MTTLKYFITSKAKRNLLKFFLTDINASYYIREAARLTGEPLNAVRRELGYLEKAGLMRAYMQGNLKYYEVVKSFPLLGEWRRIVLETTGLNITPLEEVFAGSGATKQSPGSHATAKIQASQHAPIEDGDKPIIPGARVITNHDASVIANEEKQSLEPGSSAAPQPRSILTLASLIDHMRERFNDISAITLALIHGEAARSENIPENGIELLVVADINKDILLELIASLEVTTGIDISLMHMTRSDFDYRNARGDPFVRRIWGEKKLVVKGRH